MDCECTQSLPTNDSFLSSKTSIFSDDEDVDGEDQPWTREEILIGIIYVTFYAVVTRIPMIVAVVHMRTVYELNAGWCASFFCAYCVGRMIAAYAVQWAFSMKTMVASTSTGLFSFIVIFLFEDYWWVFGGACFVLGFSESVTGFDVLLKKECSAKRFSKRRQQQTFRLVMISTTVGSAISYCLGGYLYEEFGSWGMRSVCILGAGASTIQLLCLALYSTWRWHFIMCGFKIPNASNGQKVRQDDGGTDAITRSRDRCLGSYRRMKDSPRAPRPSQRVSTVGESKLAWAPPTLREDLKRSATIMMLTVVGSMYFTPFAIGTNFATLAYYWLVVWDVGTAVSGALMAVGEFLGVALLLFLQMPCVFNSMLTFPFGKPMGVPLTSFLLGCCCFSIVFPSIYICAAGSIGVHIFNAAIHSFCNELCTMVAPVDEFAFWQGTAYLAKRFSNCTMGFVQTALFALAPQVPHVTTGVVMTLWSLVLVIYYIKEGLSPIQVNRQLEILNSVLARVKSMQDPEWTGIMPLALEEDPVPEEVVEHTEIEVVPPDDLPRLALGGHSIGVPPSRRSFSVKGEQSGMSVDGTGPIHGMAASRPRTAPIHSMLNAAQFGEKERNNMALAIQQEVADEGIMSPAQALSLGRLANDEQRSKSKSRRSLPPQATGRN